MSKRYSGKSFKDSKTKKKPQFTLKQKRRIKKNIRKGDEPGFNFSYTYGGQFHMDYPGLKNRVVFGLGGFGGQTILIDMENSRIVVLNSLHYNNKKFRYNVKKLLINPIKKGEKAFK